MASTATGTCSSSRRSSTRAGRGATSSTPTARSFRASHRPWPSSMARGASGSSCSKEPDNRGGTAMPLAMLGTFVLSASLAGAVSPSTETFAIRGRPETLRVYGTRGRPLALVASGDGGWVHLAPHIAEFLAATGYFVVGLDSRAYLSSFTKSGTTLGIADVPGDFAAVLDHAGSGAAS